ncbi:MAG: response regulator, partial [Candidatus Odinarchaeota archaeon]
NQKILESGAEMNDLINWQGFYFYWKDFFQILSRAVKCPCVSRTGFCRGKREVHGNPVILFRDDDLNQDDFRILCVDDDRDFLLLVKIALEKLIWNVNIDTASSVAEAVLLFTDRNHGIIISDYQMPGKSGLDLLEEVRASNDHVPFILLTGKGDKAVMFRAIDLGAYYLRKRVNTASLFADLSLLVSVIVKERARMIELLFIDTGLETAGLTWWTGHW